MNKIISLLLFDLLVSAPAWASPKIEIVNIREQVEIAMFDTSYTSGMGTFYYLVDRTTRQCFLVVMGSDPHPTPADCKMLEKIPAIKNFLETGKTK
jgi:hypothetical protein